MDEATRVRVMGLLNYLRLSGALVLTASDLAEIERSTGGRGGMTQNEVLGAMIVLQFSTAKGIGSRLIKWWTWSNYSHVDIVMPNGWLLGARKDGGVKVRPPDYEKFSQFARFGVICTSEQAAAILAAAQSQVGKPYDMTDIYNMLLHGRNWRETDSWICSELVPWCFEQGKKPLLNPCVEIRRITPQGCLLSPILCQVSDATTSVMVSCYIDVTP